MKESITHEWLLPLAVTLTLAGAWVEIALLRLFPPSVLPSPWEVVAALREEINSGRLLNDTVASLFRVTTGFMLAVALGVPSGLGLGLNERARAALLPLMNFLRNLSPLAWTPFAILWFGIGDVPAIFLIFIASVFPITLATMAAVANVPSVYFRVGQDYGLRGSERLTQIVLPAIAPQIITALRVTAGLAWVVVVAAEMIAGRDGLGFAIWDSRNGLRMDLLVAEMIMIGLIGIGIDRILVKLTHIPSVRWGYER